MFKIGKCADKIFQAILGSIVAAKERFYFEGQIHTEKAIVHANECNQSPSGVTIGGIQTSVQVNMCI